MESLLQQILNLLIAPPGNLVYHLILAFSVISSLQAAWIWRQKAPSSASNRLLFGLGMLLLGQLILFLSSGLAWQGALDEHFLLPPLDRAVILFSLVWITWLWNFPLPARLGDTVTGFLNLGVVLLLIFSYTTWVSQGSGYAFNYSWMDWAWELANFFVVLTGMAVLLFSRPSGWGFGVGMLSVSLAGLVAHLAITASGGDFSGYIRLSQLAAYPLLPMLLQRFTTVEAASESALAANEDALPAGRRQRSERRRYSADSRTLHAWFEVTTARRTEEILSRIAKAMSHTLLADQVFIIRGPVNQQIFLSNGYDLIREDAIDGAILDQDEFPDLTSALQNQKALRITQNDPYPAELALLCNAIDLNDPGSLMLIPFSEEEMAVSGLLFLSPFSHRQWSQEDQEYVLSEGKLIKQLIEQVRRSNETAVSEEKTEEKIHQEIKTLLQENQSLQSEINNLRSSSQPVQDVPGTDIDINTVTALQKDLLEQVTGLQAENERLQTVLKENGVPLLSPEEFDRVETELHNSLQEVAVLQNKLAQANARNITLAYEVQETWSADIPAIIEQALTDEQNLFEKKGIQLTPHLPENLQPLRFDTITLQQIILHLLRTAVSLFPAKSDLNFAIRYQEDTHPSLLGLRLADSQEEPMPEDLSIIKVPSNPIDIVGNTSLAIVKTLVEAHNGQFWLEQMPDQKYLLTVLLPVRSQALSQD